MTEPHVEIAEQSYHRCGEVAEFFPAFYDMLLASDERIPPMFENTKFDKQNRLLKHGLGLLLIYAKRPNPVLLERIGQRHSRAEVAVLPEMYPAFVESLVRAVERFDPEFTPEIAEAWRRAVAPGIEFLQSRY